MLTNFRILLRFFEGLLLSLDLILAKLKDDLRRSSVLTRPVPDSGSRLGDSFAEGLICASEARMNAHSLSRILPIFGPVHTLSWRRNVTYEIPSQLVLMK
jgi:hypothetical protein